MKTPLLLLLAALLLGVQPAEAQILNRMKDAAKRGAERAAERETARRADRAVTGLFDIADDAVRCAAGDDACARQAEADGKQVVYVDAAGEPLPVEQQHASSGGTTTAPAGAPATPATPGQGVWANYDFIPGHRLLFTDDFESDHVGDFPRRLTFKNGTMETVEGNTGRTLRAKTRGAFDVVLPEALPERFTLEFDYYSEGLYNDIRVFAVGADDKPAGTNYVVVDRNGTGIGTFERGGVEAALNQPRLTQGFHAVRVSVDGSYVKVYVDEERVANVPNADLGRSNRLRFDLIDVREGGQHNGPIYLDDIRVAAGGREMMYDRLMADGRFVTQGILFDTGSATIEPESTPTLKEIARTLQQHGDLRLRIEGHTDNTGSADANQQLSERRAAAVRDYLVQREGIDAARLESAGLGQTAPAADNGTPEGRQTNRRVELVVL